MNFFPSTSKAVAIAMAFAVLGCQPASKNPHPALMGPHHAHSSGRQRVHVDGPRLVGPSETVDHIVYCTSP